MDVYTYKCNDCNSVFELVNIEDVNELHICPKCRSENTILKRIVYNKTQFSTKRTGDYSHTSESLAISPDQIAEHHEKFPGVDVLPDGRLQFNSFRQHDRYLEKTGFVKVSQKIRHRI